MIVGEECEDEVEYGENLLGDVRCGVRWGYGENGVEIKKLVVRRCYWLSEF